eukprot:gene5115-235_t
MAIIFILEALLGCLANLGVIVVYFKRGKWNGVTAMFMVNLAVTDVSMCLLMIPYSTVQLVMFPHTGVAFNIVHNALLSGLRFASIATLVAISYERMESVTRPLRVHGTRVKMTISVIWLLSIPCFLVPIFALNSKSFHETRICNAKLQIFQLWDLIVFVILCIIMLCNYRSVQNAARSRTFALPIMIIKGTVAVPGVSNLSSQIKTQKDKVVNLSRLILSSVMLLWSPFLGLSFAKFFVGNTQELEIASVVLLAIGYSNHVLHPLLYAVPSSHWRKAAMQTFGCLFDRSRHETASSTQKRRVCPTPVEK